VKVNVNILVLFFVVLLSCKNSDNKTNTGVDEDTGQGVIEFKNTSHSFGEISEGEVVSFTFQFENTGTSNLIVNNVKASCGCTTPEWTKEPILPGEKGKLVVTFDSEGRSGNQIKVITVYTNSTIKNTEELTITAKII
jgi:hypothetical protein